METIEIINETNEIEKYKLMVLKQREASKRWKLNNPDKVKAHNDKYNEKHKNRYQTDEAYKQQQKEASKRYYYKKKAELNN